jgi:hypothetical protein
VNGCGRGVRADAVAQVEDVGGVATHRGDKRVEMERKMGRNEMIRIEVALQDKMREGLSSMGNRGAMSQTEGCGLEGSKGLVVEGFCKEDEGKFEATRALDEGSEKARIAVWVGLKDLEGLDSCLMLVFHEIKGGLEESLEERGGRVGGKVAGDGSRGSSKSNERDGKFFS